MERGEIIKKILLAASGVSPIGGPTALVGIDKALYSLGLWYKSQDRRGRYRIRKVADVHAIPVFHADLDHLFR